MRGIRRDGPTDGGEFGVVAGRAERAGLLDEDQREIMIRTSVVTLNDHVQDHTGSQLRGYGELAQIFVHHEGTHSP